MRSPRRFSPGPLFRLEPLTCLSKSCRRGKCAGRGGGGGTEARGGKSGGRVWAPPALRGPLPQGNFKKGRGVAVVGGGSACDKYVLTRVREDEGNVTLDINRVRPPTGHMCIMIFSPSTIVASLPQTSKAAKANIADGGPAGESTR